MAIRPVRIIVTGLRHAVYPLLGVLTFLVFGLPVLAFVTWAQSPLARIMFGPAEAQ